MPFRPIRAAKALCFVAAIAAATAVSATPVTLPLNYQFAQGNSSILYSGSVTFDDAIWTPNRDIFDSLEGIIDVTLHVTGPGNLDIVFGIDDLEGWVFVTDGSNRVTDLNFFFGFVGMCTLEGEAPLVLGFHCAEDEEPQVLRALVPPRTDTPAKPVPTLDAASLALLALALAALSLPALRRRGR